MARCILYTRHKIQVYDSTLWSELTELSSCHHKSVLQHFRPPVKSLVPIYSQSPSPPWPQATPRLLSFSVNLNLGCFRAQYFSASQFSLVQLEGRHEAAPSRSAQLGHSPGGWDWVGDSSRGSVSSLIRRASQCQRCKVAERSLTGKHTLNLAGGTH